MYTFLSHCFDSTRVWRNLNLTTYQKWEMNTQPLQSSHLINNRNCNGNTYRAYNYHPIHRRQWDCTPRTGVLTWHSQSAPEDEMEGLWITLHVFTLNIFKVNPLKWKLFKVAYVIIINLMHSKTSLNQPPPQIDHHHISITSFGTQTIVHSDILTP